GLAHNVHCCSNGCLELRCFQIFCSCGQSFLSQGQNLRISFHQRGWNWHFTEILMSHRDRAVDQVAPAVGQLIIDAANKLIPGEVSVSIFWSCYRDEVAQCIRTEFLEEVFDIDDHTLGGGELRTRHGQELRRDNLGGKVQFTIGVQSTVFRSFACITKQLRWPDLRVEGDVVFAHEVVMTYLWVLPVVLPSIWVAATVCPLNG